MKDLKPREKEILKSIVQLYSSKGEPVGSKVVSTLLGNMSSATVRNIFKTIEKMGYITKSHFSSGRIPTDVGLRYFIDNILKIKKISHGDQKKLDTIWQNEPHNLSDLLEKVPSLLSSVSHYTGIVLARDVSISAIKHIDFVILNDGNVLVILVDSIGNVTNRIIQVESEVKQSDLEKLRNYINENLQSKTLFEIKRHLIKEMSILQKKYDLMLDKIISLSKGELKASTSGESNVFDYLNVSDMQEIRNILESFKQNQFYLDLFRKVSDSDDVKIFVGSESDMAESANCSAILTKYEINDGEIVGVLGVIGPKRMNYGKIIPIVDYTKNLLISLYENDE